MSPFFCKTMHYYIDGYNFLFFLFDEVDPLKSKRDEVISEVQEILCSLSLKVSIIFDSHHNHSSFFPSSFNQRGLEIVYTASKQTADEYILEKLSFSKNNSLKTIVTSDNFLAKESRKLGAHTVSIDEFLKVILKKKKNKHLNESKIEHSFENERWLKIFEENFKKKEY